MHCGSNKYGSKRNGHDEMSFGDFLGWMGWYFSAQVYPSFHPIYFFSTNARDERLSPPCLVDVMSGKTLERINACMKLDDEEESLEHKDRFFWIRKLSKGFDYIMDA